MTSSDVAGTSNRTRTSARPWSRRSTTPGSIGPGRTSKNSSGIAFPRRPRKEERKQAKEKKSHEEVNKEAEEKKEGEEPKETKDAKEEARRQSGQ